MHSSSQEVLFTAHKCEVAPMKSLFRSRSGHLLWLLFNLAHRLSSVLLFCSAQWLDTHLSRLPCSGQLCLGPKSPLSLFSGKKGSLGIPGGVTQETTIRVKSLTWKNRTFFSNGNKTFCRLHGKKSEKQIRTFKRLSIQLSVRRSYL